MINELLKDFKKRNRKKLLKRVDNHLTLWYDIKVATAAKTNRKNISDEVDL